MLCGRRRWPRRRAVHAAPVPPRRRPASSPTRMHGELWVGPVRRSRRVGGGLDLDGRAARRLADASARPARRARRPLGRGARREHGRRRSADLERTLSRPAHGEGRRGRSVSCGCAIDATVAGSRAVVAEMPARHRAVGGERWLQGTFDRHARTYGNGPGYSTIVGCGPHAPTLHWVRCDGPVLPDAGAAARHGRRGPFALHRRRHPHRSRPAGTFSAAQREVHDLVEKAHRAGTRADRPRHGRTSTSTSPAMEVVAQGLPDWGLLPVSVDEALSPDGQQHRRYLVCGIGHHLGLDVHDCARRTTRTTMGAEPRTRRRDDGRAGPLLPRPRPDRAAGAARHRRALSKTTSW